MLRLFLFRLSVCRFVILPGVSGRSTCTKRTASPYAPLNGNVLQQAARGERAAREDAGVEPFGTKSNGRPTLLRTARVKASFNRELPRVTLTSPSPGVTRTRRGPGSFHALLPIYLLHCLSNHLIRTSHRFTFNFLTKPLKENQQIYKTGVFAPKSAAPLGKVIFLDMRHM